MRDDAAFLRPYPYGLSIDAGPGTELVCPSCGAWYQLLDGPGITRCVVCLDELDAIRVATTPARQRRCQVRTPPAPKVMARTCGILADARPGHTQGCARCRAAYVLLAGHGWSRCAICFRPLRVVEADRNESPPQPRHDDFRGRKSM